MGIASLVLGIVSLCISIFSAGYLGVIGTICAILGIIFGVIQYHEILPNGQLHALLDRLLFLEALYGLGNR